MKLIIYILVIISTTQFVQSQVGINTNNPTKILDINGDLNLRKELKIGGTDLDAGQVGTKDQLLQIKADADTSNNWKTYQIANGTGSLSLYYLNTTKDDTGILFNTTGSTAPYNMDDNATDWTFLTKNKDNFVVKDNTNSSKVTLSLQTTVQINRAANSTGTSASFACGIFLKKGTEAYKLKAVRSDVIRGAPGSYKIFNLNVTLDKLAQGSYEVQAACRNRQLGSSTSNPPTLVNIGIGVPTDTSKLNQAMANTTMTTTVLHPY